MGCPSVPVAADVTASGVRGRRLGRAATAPSMSCIRGPGVAVRHVEAGVPHQALDDPGRHAGRVGQGGALAPEGVEVEDPPRVVAVGDAGGRPGRPAASPPPRPGGQGKTGSPAGSAGQRTGRGRRPGPRAGAAWRSRRSSCRRPGRSRSDVTGQANDSGVKLAISE